MTKQPAPAQRTPLEERLINLVRLKGPITVADYMADALGHPHEGYYMTKAPFGADGDFTTAPEISQIFGELIGVWLIAAWRAIGAPEEFQLVELGPGRGVLMNDILRAARLRPKFSEALNLWFVETSGRLRHEQRKRLKGSDVEPQWADSWDDVPAGPTLLVANEFLDCLPIRQFERIGQRWRERMVGLNAAGDALAFTHHATPAAPDLDLPDPMDAEEGDIFEYCAPARELAGSVARRLKENGGAALFIDYGHMRSGFGDTLQAVRNHEYWPPLDAPGSADLTAHVDFDAFARAAIDGGAVVHGPTPQGRFLEKLGLELRMEALAKGKSPAEAEAIRQGAWRISAPNQMGEIFKVLCVADPESPPPPGFDA